MKLFNIFTKPLQVTYKHQICSFAFLFVLLVALLTAILPAVIVYRTNKEEWKSQLIIYEQPHVKYNHEYVVHASFIERDQQLAMDVERKTVVCSSYSQFTGQLDSVSSQECSSIEVRNWRYCTM